MNVPLISWSKEAGILKRVYVNLAAIAALGVASPAHATGSLICRTGGARPVEVQMVIGMTAVSHIVQARLYDDGRQVDVSVAQAWLEPGEVRLDLTGPNEERHELRLRAKWNGKTYDGTVWRGGKRRWVRCEED